MSSDIEVFVATGERNLLAGRMYSHRHRGAESASFVYDDRYLADPEAYALDPALPLVTGALQTPIGRALFGAFADSLPDRWGRTLIQRAERISAGPLPDLQNLQVDLNPCITTRLHGYTVSSTRPGVKVCVMKGKVRA